ncbi:MAG: Peptidoglycan O-acetyltransferase [Myxococcota bacterium]|nr:Peptidoglycan O-acetyltransferase [Myxococcota bacterium]
MIFNSLHFLIFYPIVVVVFFLLPHRFRWVWLLAASCYFYMAWRPEYIILLLAPLLIDYWVAIWIEQTESQKRKLQLLLISLISNLGLLVYFKYLGFFNESVRSIATALGIEYTAPVLDILLPVGISFYTFQTLSYTIDVYRGQMKACRHLGIFGVFIAFFPQLVAGPIERATNLLPQFFPEQRFNLARAADGVKLMLWGFFKKVVIADTIASYVNNVYNHPGDHGAIQSLIATYFFAFQIYCDFSGYSDIAIGSAQVMGFNLMDNFHRPYSSQSVTEFWRRWHISLSSWFRDYLYIPLGGNRGGVFVRRRNVFLVFLISGLWHGANWTFVVWGALHGLFVMVESFTRDGLGFITKPLGLQRFPLLDKAARVIITFHLVLFAWIFFRANNIQDAFTIIGNFADWGGASLSDIPGVLGWQTFLFACSAIAFMEAVHFMQPHENIRQFFSGIRTLPRWAMYYAMFIALMGVVMFGKQEGQQFIYFQF